MRRRIVALLMLGLLVGCGSTPTPADPEAEEYAVYRALIETMYLPGPGRIVISDHTRPGIGGDWEEVLQYVNEEISGIEPATLESFRARNAQPELLRDRFNLAGPVVLLSAQEMEDIFQNTGGGWDAFYRRYPGAQGTMELSRVGFNDDMTQALVYVGNQSYYLAGAGYYVLLVKVNGIWAVRNQAMAWIS